MTWVLFATLLTQATNVDKKIPGFNSFKIVYTFWLGFCLTFSKIYGNSIYAQMVLPPKLRVIDSIQELFEAKVRGEIVCTFFADTSSYSLIKVKKIVEINQDNLKF